MAEQWKGIGKIVEECGELLQVAGKAIAFPDCDHPDGKGTVSKRFMEEMADVYAALDYFRETNDLDCWDIRQRRIKKLNQFRQWGLTGIPSPPLSK